MYQLEELYIESSPNILEYKIKDVPLWLILRTIVLNDLVAAKHKLDNPHVVLNPFELSIRQKLSYIANCIRYNPFLAHNNTVVIFGAAVNNVKEGNAYLNKLYYDMWKEGATLMEYSYNYNFFLPKKESVYFMDIINIVTRLGSKLFTLSGKELSEINSFVSFIKSKSNYKLRFDYYRNVLIKTFKGINIKKYLYKLLFDRIKPKLVFIEDAHYFSNIPIIMLAKDLGIKVVEYQHGYIGEDHVAYNFHPAIRKRIKKYLPDYLLTWGKYWSNRVNTPSKKYEIGNFYLHRKREETRYKTNVHKKTIALVSAGTKVKDYTDIGLELRKSLKGFEFIIRPHPLERAVAKKRYKKLLEVGFKLDFSDLYNEFFNKVSIVISLEKTTVLYEAILFTNKVYYISEDNEQNLPFIVSTRERIINDIMDKNIPTKDIYLLFEENPLQNYKQFLKEVMSDNNN